MEKNYTKEETIKHLNKLVSKLTDKNIDKLFSKKVRKYIRKKMPISMRAYLQAITLGEVISVTNEVEKENKTENKTERRIKRLTTEDYNNIITTIIINFRGREDLTKKDIMSLIENKLNIKITQGRWNNLKEKFPYVYKDKKYILISKGKNRGTKWGIVVE